MKKILISLGICSIVLLGVSCKKQPPQELPQETPARQIQTDQPEQTPPKNPRLPVLQAGKLIMVGGQPLTIGHTASPEVADWNNDGKKDLLVGTYITGAVEIGKVMLFLNQGTDEAPLFSRGEFMQAGGEVISVGAG